MDPRIEQVNNVFTTAAAIEDDDEQYLYLEDKEQILTGLDLDGYATLFRVHEDALTNYDRIHSNCSALRDHANNEFNKITDGLIETAATFFVEHYMFVEKTFPNGRITDSYRRAVNTIAQCLKKGAHRRMLDNLDSWFADARGKILGEHSPCYVKANPGNPFRPENQRALNNAYEIYEILKFGRPRTAGGTGAALFDLC